jgi:uncharacterized membrane protein
MSAEATQQASVIEVNFQQDANAYEALTNLKELDSQGQVQLRAAAVVVRGDDGRIAVKDEAGGGTIAGTATGGTIGLLIGILGGPFGVLLGGATGLLVGSLFDMEDAEDSESVLSEISKSGRPGHAALLAQVNEPSPQVIDTAMASLGGTVLRRGVEEVEAEIAAAEEAQRAAKRQARKELFEQRRAKQKSDVDARIDALKAKLHHQKPEQASVS